MNTVGLIVTPLAYLNVKDKQKAYDEALMKYQQLRGYAQRVVDEYQQELDQLQAIMSERNENGDTNVYTPIAGIKILYTMYVGVIVGKKMSIGSEITFVNNSDKSVCLAHIYVEPKLLGVNMSNNEDPLLPYVGYAPGANYTIEPGHQITIKFGEYFNCQFLPKSSMKLLREIICKKAGKSLITSVAKDTMIKEDGVLTGDVYLYYYYKDKNGNLIRTKSRWVDVPGNIIYQGEAWNPGLWSAISDSFKYM